MPIDRLSNVDKYIMEFPMKNFREYLEESKRNYSYTIKMAFKPNDELLDEVEKALARFDLISLSKPQSMPIQKIDSDFHGIFCPEVYILKAVFGYPATPQIIQGVLSQVNMDLELVNVVSTDHDESVKKEQEDIEKNDDGALLGKDYEKQDNKKISADNFGSEYNDKLVKNSLTKKVTVPNPPDPAITTNDLPQGKTSPVGSHQNKLPKPKSARR